MALSTYTELQAAIASWTNRDDLTDAIVDAIRMTEADLDVDEGVQDQVRTSITLDQSTVALPANCREVKALYFDTSTLRGPITLVPEHDLPTVRGWFGRETGTPIHAAIVDNGTGIMLSPGPDQSYTGRITYWAYIAPLSASQASNWILARHPQVYLYGALCELETFLKNDERLALWKSRYDRALDRLKLFVNRRRFSANTLTNGPRRSMDG